MFEYYLIHDIYLENVPSFFLIIQKLTLDYDGGSGVRYVIKML